MILLSILFSFLGNVAGLILSYYLNVPSGALIIFVLILIFFAAKIIKTFAKKNRPAMA
jgi:zinc transport system permease protein